MYKRFFSVLFSCVFWIQWLKYNPFFSCFKVFFQCYGHIISLYVNWQMVENVIIIIITIYINRFTWVLMILDQNCLAWRFINFDQTTLCMCVSGHISYLLFSVKFFLCVNNRLLLLMVLLWKNFRDWWYVCVYVCKFVKCISECYICCVNRQFFFSFWIKQKKP